MARQRMPSSLPSAVERRELLYGRASQKADHGALAARYREQGRLVDALEFFVKAGDEAGVDEVRSQAVRDGDAFLLAQVARMTGAPQDAALWRETAENAERAGKSHFARAAYREVGDEDAIARLDGHDEGGSAAPSEDAGTDDDRAA